MTHRQRLLRFLSRIWIRLLAFNVLLVFLPIAALWSLENTEKYLLALQEDSNVQQGRLLAAALGERGPLEAHEARRIIRNLRQRTDARLRILDPDRNLLADSSRFGPRAPEGEVSAAAADEPESDVRDTLLYRLGSWIYRLYNRALVPPKEHSPDAEFYAAGEEYDGEEIREALAGNYGNASRPSADGSSYVLYSAIPIRSDGQVVGIALVTKSTRTVLQRLYALRIQAFSVVLVSIGVAIVLSFLVSTTIVRPISRLRNQALAILDPRGRLKGRFDVYRRLDEIGDLSRSLHGLTRRLEKHIRFIEGFASDVSHEFKNPLASIRSATDLLAEIEEPAERQRFHQMVLRDLSRLERLLSGVREITQIDAHMEAEPTETVRLDDLLRRLVEQFELRRGRRVEYRLECTDDAVEVDGVPHRLAQVFENLLANARSFSPPEGEIGVRLEVRDKKAVVWVRDQGPGIPEEHLEKIFARFFSYRPQSAGAGDDVSPQGDDGHTGLGLSIVRSIVEGSGGTVTARNRPDGGALFEVELPLASR